MKSIGFLAFAITVSGTVFAGSPLLITQKIDANKLIVDLPVSDRQISKNSDGRKRQTWSITGVDIGRLEVVGNNQADADQVVLQCRSYDKAGNSVSAKSPESACHRLFVRLLKKFTTTPDFFAKKLIDESALEKRTESRTLDDLSIETDGETYAIRRMSRLQPR